ncbi:MAG: hypothetical protein HY553_16560 [Elusimicrobia bacterium]|nr:hypothetical protein [Elusimicrobiota bacterium]
MSRLSPVLLSLCLSSHVSLAWSQAAGPGCCGTPGPDAIRESIRRRWEDSWNARLIHASPIGSLEEVSGEWTGAFSIDPTEYHADPDNLVTLALSAPAGEPVGRAELAAGVHRNGSFVSYFDGLFGHGKPWILEDGSGVGVDGAVEFCFRAAPGDTLILTLRKDGKPMGFAALARKRVKAANESAALRELAEAAARTAATR